MENILRGGGGNMQKLLKQIRSIIKRKKEVPPPVAKPVPVVEPQVIEEFSVGEPIDDPIPENRVIVHWKGKSKIKEQVEPEIEPEDDEEIYVCELCPETRLHKREDIFQCQYCNLWYCEKHLSWHIYKKHRNKNYTVSANTEGGATYKVR